MLGLINKIAGQCFPGPCTQTQEDHDPRAMVTGLWLRWGTKARANEIWWQLCQQGKLAFINRNKIITLPLSPDESEEIASQALSLPATSAVFCFSKIQIF